MILELRPEVIHKLNQQYKTFEFQANLTAKGLIKCV